MRYATLIHPTVCGGLCHSKTPTPALPTGGRETWACAALSGHGLDLSVGTRIKSLLLLFFRKEESSLSY